MSRLLSSEASEARTNGAGRSPKYLVTSETARLCTTVYKNALRAVVLTGSVARDEGTFVTTGTGSTLLGDAEFFAVFEDGRALPASADLRLVEGRIAQRLQGHGVTARVSVSAVHARYF